MSDLTFIKLKKNIKKDSSAFVQRKLAVLGDCATQHLATALKGYAYEKQIGLQVFDADYNQILAQVADPSSELYEFAPQDVLFYMCTEKMYESYCETAVPERKNFAETVMARIRGYWDMLNSGCKANILQFNFVEENDRIFGNYALKTEDSYPYQVKKLNFLMMEAAREVKNVYLVDLNDIRCRLGKDVFFDSKLYYIAKMPISMNALPDVAAAVIDVVCGFLGRMKKVAVLDLDNTLWGGVIGDDGLDNIQIGELGTGHAFTEFQMWLKELKKRGIVLAICSKNNEDTAKEPFIKHPEMVLRLDDIAIFVANWEDKASNIRYIKETLNLGMDSFVFLDDNPFERNLVRSMIPEITVPELPEDPAEYVSYLKTLNLFETISYSEEDESRTKQYQAEIGRVKLQDQFASYDEYLKGLEMLATDKPFEPFYYSRIAQLTQRSNQFNLRTVRYTEGEIEQTAADENCLTRYFCLKDKFGDHGLISVLIMKKQDEETLFVDTWLMSCRVLKRGMEEYIINRLIECAKEAGFKKVIGEYLKTPKNAMVETIYEKMGFTPLGNGRYEADVDTYVPGKCFIMREED